MSSQMIDGNRTGPWTPEEDETLKRLVALHGARGWSNIAEEIPGRNGKSCRLRWCNQLDPTVNRNPFTDWEDAVIIQAWRNVNNKWAQISKYLQARTDNSVKNHWNSTLKRKYECWEKDHNDKTNPGQNPGQLGDNRFFMDGYSLSQLQAALPEAEVFVPPVDDGAAAAAAAPGDSGATGCPGCGDQSADSMSTPQSHFKARTRRASSKRSRDSDSEIEEEGAELPGELQWQRLSPEPDFDGLPTHIREGLRMLYELGADEKELLLTAARLVNLPGAGPLPAKQEEGSDREHDASPPPQSPPKPKPRHAVKQISLTATASAFAPGLITPASDAVRSRLAAGSHRCSANGYVLVSPTDAAINFLDASDSPLPLLPAAGAAEGDGAAAKPAGDATQESLDAVKAGAAAGGGEAEQQDAKGDGEKDEAAPAKTPARGIAFEPSRAPEATPIPFMCQDGGSGLFSEPRHTDAARTPIWGRPLLSPEPLRSLDSPRCAPAVGAATEEATA